MLGMGTLDDWALYRNASQLLELWYWIDTGSLSIVLFLFCFQWVSSHIFTSTQVCAHVCVLRWITHAWTDGEHTCTCTHSRIHRRSPLLLCVFVFIHPHTPYARIHICVLLAFSYIANQYHELTTFTTYKHANTRHIHWIRKEVFHGATKMRAAHTLITHIFISQLKKNTQSNYTTHIQ